MLITCLTNMSRRGFLQKIGFVLEKSRKLHNKGQHTTHRVCIYVKLLGSCSTFVTVDKNRLRTAFHVLSQCRMLSALLEDFLGQYPCMP